MKFQSTITSGVGLMMVWCLIILINTSPLSAMPSVQSIMLDVDARDIAWSPDGSLIAVGTESGVSVYTDDLQDVATLPEYSQPILAIDWDPSSKFIAAVGYPYDTGVIYIPTFTTSLLIWERQPDDTFSLYKQIDYPERTNVVDLAWSPDSTMLAVWESEYIDQTDIALSDIHVLSAIDWSTVSHLQNTYTTTYSNIAWSPDSTKIASGGSPGCYEPRGCDANDPALRSIDILFISDALTGERLHFASMPAWVFGVDWYSQDRIAAANSAFDAIYDENLNELIRDNVKYAPGYIQKLPNTSELLISSLFKDIRIIGEADLLPIALLEIEDLTALSISPDGSQVAVLNSNHQIAIYDLETFSTP